MLQRWPCPFRVECLEDHSRRYASTDAGLDHHTGPQPTNDRPGCSCKGRIAVVPTAERAAAQRQVQLREPVLELLPDLVELCVFVASASCA